MGYYIPETLKSFNNWILWKHEDGKKKPYSAKYNGFASVTKPAQWASFAAAANKLKYTDDYNGLGFVFSENCELVFIDLDNCIDQNSGDISSFAQAILKLFKGNYTEYSQSGAGLHIICKGRIPAAYKSEQIEIYKTGRYCAITGNAYEIAEPQPAQEALNLLCKYFKITDKPAQIQQTEATQSDNIIIAKATNGANGEQFAELWRGEWENRYKTQSSADMRLISLLWYYSRNVEQVTRLFMLSGLGQRDKARRADYIERTIAAAARNTPAPKQRNSTNSGSFNRRSAADQSTTAYKRKWND